MKTIFDFAVVGAGPAGSVTALWLARGGARVALFEATDFDNERYGETLPPEMNPVLREAGLADVFAELNSVEAPGIVSTWGSEFPAHQDFLSNAHGCGWHIDRNAFDRMIARAAEEAGAVLFTGYAARVTDVPAPFIVDASGRAGLRLDDEHSYHRDDLQVAIALRLSGAESQDLRTLIEATPHGWWYTAPIPGDTLVAMFFTDPDIYADDGIVVGQQLEFAPMTRERLAPTQILSSRIVQVPSACRRHIYGENWVAVGDSASAYDPLSGRGIVKAFRHGEAAANAILSRTIPDYAARVRREFDEYVRQRRAHYANEERWPASKFWIKRRYQA